MGLTKKLFLGIFAAFFLSAVSTSLIPFALDAEGNLSVAGYAAGVMFWAGLLTGCTGYVLLYRREKHKLRQKIQKRKFPSALCFCSNRYAAAADAVMAVGIIGTIYCTVNLTVSQIIAVIFLFLALAGVYAHFLLNGKMYQYIWNIRPLQYVKTEKRKE